MTDRDPAATSAPSRDTVAAQKAKSRAEQLIAARYSRVIVVTDAVGRKISVRRLRVAEQMMVSELSDSISAQVLLMRAASVVSVDDGGTVTTFKSVPDRRLVDRAFRDRLDAIVDRLSDEGIAAVAEALKQHEAADKDALEVSTPTTAAVDVSGVPEHELEGV